MSKSKRQANFQIDNVDAYQPNVTTMRKAIEPFKPLTKSQEAFVNKLQTKDLNFCFGSAGSGKAQPLYSKVLTPSGWSTMGEMRIGSEVIAANGENSKVIGVFPQGVKDIFEVTFSDGSKARACADHLWECNVPGARYHRKKTEKRVVTTSFIKNWIDDPRPSTTNISIDMYSPVDTVPVDLPMDPYVLGVLIGDGCMRGNINLSSADDEILSRVGCSLPDNLQIRKIREKGYDYCIKDNSPNRGGGRGSGKNVNSYKDILRDLGLYGSYSYEKFIPPVYLKASIDQKLELLRGLLDTDGTACRHGGVIFYSTSPTLARDVRELCWSLGAKCSLKIKKPFFTYKGVRKEGRVCYVMTISYKNPKELFHLSRKKDRVSEEYDKNQLKRIIRSVELVGREEAQCIMIDHPSHLYVTDDYVITHNTYCAAALAAEALQNHKVARIIVTRPAVEADGEEMGFLPGEIDEKFAPWFEPFRDALEDRLGASTVEYHLKRGNIIPTPLAYMRGKSFRDSWVIMDEAQNCTPGQMKMFLTRMGQDCRMTILGDVKQTDLKVKNGMQDAIEKLKDLPEVGFHEFFIEDCVRHGIVKKILERYER